MGGTSRMNREIHVRICGRLGAKFPGPTRRMAKENPGWGYDRIVGAMANLGLRLSDQTVGNILRRHDIPPAPKRKQATSWKDFIRAHMAVLVATDFFTVEVPTLRGLITYYGLFFIHLRAGGYATLRAICLAGVTRHPDQEWMGFLLRSPDETMSSICCRDHAVGTCG